MRISRLAAWSLRGLALPALVACGDHQIRLTGPGPIQAPRLVVRVVDADSRQPIAGAHVLLVPFQAAAATQASVVAGAVSDEAGVATLAPVAPGRYRVHLRRIAYAQTAREVDLRDPATGAVTLTLAARRAPPICDFSPTLLFAP